MNGFHECAIGVPNPNGSCEFAGVANEPGITVVLGGSGLARCGLIDSSPSSRSTLDHLIEDVIHLGYRLGIQDSLPHDFVFVEHIALGVGHFCHR